MLKRFGLAGVLFAVSAVAPLTAAAQSRNYNNNHNQAQWAPQAQRGESADGTRGGYNNAQNFRGRAPAPMVRNGRDDRREPENNFRRDRYHRDDRYSRFRFDRDDFGRR